MRTHRSARWPARPAANNLGPSAKPSGVTER
jgi:hypothetical protein